MLADHDPGPSPVVRAALGLALGAALGLLIALLVPRERGRAAPPPAE